MALPGINGEGVVPRAEAGRSAAATAPRDRLAAATALVVGLSLSGCSQTVDDQPPAEAPPPTSSATVDILQPLELADSPDAVVVTVRISQDPLGGFLVADPDEAQVRRYDSDGQLQWNFGTRGEGPGEFSYPYVVLRLPSSDLVVFENTGEINVFSDAGTSLRRTISHEESPFRRVHDAEMLSDGRIVVAGRSSDAVLLGPQIHVWNPVDNTIDATALEPVLPEEMQAAINVVSLSSVDVRNDTIAAVFALSDSVYLFRPDGARLAVLPLRADAFRRLSTPVPVRGTRNEALDWIGSFSILTDVAWIPNETAILVQHQDRRQGPHSADIIWHLTRMPLGGGEVLQVHDGPRFMVRVADGLLFMQPGSLLESQLAFGRVR